MAIDPQEKSDFYLDVAARFAGRPVAEVTAEWQGLNTGPGRLTAEEYVKFSLYDSRRFTEAAKRAFLSDRLHWPIVWASCDPDWKGATEDKWLAARILDMARVPTPRIIAVADSSQRHYPGTPVMRSEQQFRAFLAQRQGKPFFAKPLKGFASRGVFLCESWSDRSIRLTGHGERLIADMWREHFGRLNYVFQPVQRNHPFFAGICENLATVRIGAGVYDDSVRLVFTFLKMPGAGNLEDRFHCLGNMACSLDPETGEIQSIRSRGEHIANVHTVHPENGRPLIGLRLPHWPDLLATVAQAARLFAPLRYQTMDIAITDKGPVVIEVNIGGGFAGPQMALGRGMLDTPFGAFLKASGIDVAKLKVPAR
jgi:hypothetical protein